MAKRSALELYVESIVGLIVEWEQTPSYIRFRLDESVKLETLEKLSVALGTTAINFYFGCSSEGDYSEYTPGQSGQPGSIEVLFPIKPADSNVRI